MKNLLVGLFLLLLLVGGIGLYRGWFTVEVDQDKIKKDADTSIQKAKEIGKDIKDRVTGTKPANAETKPELDSPKPNNS